MYVAYEAGSASGTSSPQNVTPTASAGDDEGTDPHTNDAHAAHSPAPLPGFFPDWVCHTRSFAWSTVGQSSSAQRVSNILFFWGASFSFLGAYVRVEEGGAVERQVFFLEQGGHSMCAWHPQVRFALQRVWGNWSGHISVATRSVAVTPLCAKQKEKMASVFQLISDTGITLTGCVSAVAGHDDIRSYKRHILPAAQDKRRSSVPRTGETLDIAR